MRAGTAPPWPATSSHVVRLHERDAVALLLVRAVEEHDPSLFGRPEVFSEAALAAVDAQNDAELLDKRTAYLFLRLPRSIRAWARVALLPENTLGIIAPATFVIGLCSNYLGPSGFVHVARNPLALLIMWNLGVYAVLAGRRLWSRSLHPAPASRSDLSGASAGTPPESRVAVELDAATDPESGLLDRLVARQIEHLSEWWHRRKHQAVTKVTSIGEAASAFREAYWRQARPTVVARVETLLHLGAIGLFFGATVGTYIRGLFFEYNAVWRSTFVTNPPSVATFLNLFLGPASLLLNGSFLTADAVRPLLSPQGTSAGDWIHLLALTGALVILCPRAVLAWFAARHARRSAGRIEIDLGEDYYVRTVHAVREGQINQVRNGITTAIQLQIAEFSESVAVFVRDQFFDKTVAPTLLSFRNKGGTIADLEADLARRSASFEPALSEYLRVAQMEFDQSVRSRVQAVIGRALAQAPTIEMSAGDIAIDHGLPESVATRLGDTIGAAVTTAAAATAATLSGGIGKSVGVAVVAHLLGTSGPIGLLIGAFVAFFAVGGTYVLGRDRITAAVKGRRLPAFVVAAALRDSKLERTRDATYSQVKQEIHSRLEPHVASMVEAILRQLSISIAAVVRSRRDA